MSEQKAYTVFRTNVVRQGDRIDRIENLIGVGFPDTNGCFSGSEFWMEIKAPQEPKRGSTPLFGSNHKLSVAQRNWFLRQRRAGGRGFIYIETDRRRLLLAGKHADAINELTVAELIFLCLWNSSRPTTKSHWSDLREILVSHV